MSTLKVRNAANSGWLDWSLVTTPTYTIVPSTGTVNEGSSVTFLITTTGVPDGTTLYWTATGTTSSADFTDGLMSGSVLITSNAGSFVRTLTSDGITDAAETIVMQLRTDSTVGLVVATAATVTVVDTSGAPELASSLLFTRNDLDFVYSTVRTSAVPSYMELVLTLDTTNFFTLATNSTDHVVLALDTAGDSSVLFAGTRDHCGPVERHGERLWDVARGFIIMRSGQMYAEHWYAGGPSPAFALLDLGVGFNPLTTPVFTVRIRAGYRAGTYAEQMEIDIWAGTAVGGTFLTGGSVAWGWDWSGTHRVAVAGISNFVSPNTTGCVETSAAGSAYGATVLLSNYSLTLIPS